MICILQKNYPNYENSLIIDWAFCQNSCNCLHLKHLIIYINRLTILEQYKQIHHSLYIQLLKYYCAVLGLKRLDFEYHFWANILFNHNKSEDQHWTMYMICKSEGCCYTASKRSENKVARNSLRVHRIDWRSYIDCY